MVGFLKIMAKNEFRLQRGTGDQGGKTQYRHTVSIHSYHKSICIGNGMTVSHPPTLPCTYTIQPSMSVVCGSGIFHVSGVRHWHLPCGAPVQTAYFSVLYQKVNSEAKTCTSTENVYGLEQCINGHYNWNALSWSFAFLRRRDESTFVALIWIFVILQKRETWTRTRGARSESIDYIPKRLRAGVNWHNFNTVNGAYKGSPCMHKHMLGIYVLESIPSHGHPSMSLESSDCRERDTTKSTWFLRAVANSLGMVMRKLAMRFSDWLRPLFSSVSSP
jgi:hypothetical protein